MPLDYYFLGDIKNVESGQCLDTMGRKSGELLGMGYCHGLGGNQVFSYTKRQQVTADDNCLDASSMKGPVKLVRCHGMGGNQAWMYYNDVSSTKQKLFPFCKFKKKSLPRVRIELRPDI